MRRPIVLAAIVVALIAVAFFLLIPRPGDAPKISPQAAETPGASASVSPPTPILSTGESPVLPPPERAVPAELGAGHVRLLPGTRDISADLNSAAQSPENDIAVVEAVVTEYRRIFGQNPPGGLNIEITAALTGANEKRLAILPPDSPALNAEGELVDRWGTPFLFHPVSREVMEVLSAGPDRKLWTADDLGELNPASAE